MSESAATTTHTPNTAPRLASPASQPNDAPANDNGSILRAVLWCIPLGILAWAVVALVGWVVLSSMFEWMS